MKLVLFLLIILADLWSAEVTQTLKLRQENAILTDKLEFQKATIYSNYKVQSDFEDDSSIIGIVTLQADLKDNIEPDKFKTQNYGNFSKPLALGTNAVLKLRELYYEKEVKNLLFKAGKMQTVWGKADGIKLIDKLNPQDFSEFILAPFEESRIPLWTLSTLATFESSELEFIWIPDTTYHKIPTRDAEYAFSTSRIIPKNVEAITVINEPSNSLSSSDIALRYSKMFDNLEVGFYYMYLYHDSPVLYQDLDLSTKTVTINPSFERVPFYGMSLDYSNGEFVYRVELGLNNDKSFLNTSQKRGIVKSDEVAYIIGIDWYGLEESLLSMQLNQSYLLSDKNGFVRDKVDNTITLLYKKDFMNNTLHAELLTIHNINDADGLLKAKVQYEIDEETLVYGGVNYFYGNADGLYGQFEEQNRMVFGIERTF